MILQTIKDFFEAYDSFAIFLSAISFYTLGLVILLRIKPSKLEIASALPWLAAFGLIHSAHDWSDLFGEFIFGVEKTQLFLIVSGALFIISIIALAVFSVKYLVNLTENKLYYLILVVMAAIFILLYIFVPPKGSAADVYDHMVNLARYPFYIFGDILAGVCFVIQYIRLNRQKMNKSIARSFLYAGICFFIFAFFGGAISHTADFWPANFLNGKTFNEFTGFPVDLPRAFLALLIAFFVARALDIFDFEVREKLEAEVTDRKKAQEELKNKDIEIRETYEDIFFAVTGGKLILTTKDELANFLGQTITEPKKIISYEELSGIRKTLKDVLQKSFPHLENIDDIILAVNEGLTNAVKHAGLGQYAVYQADDTAQILISDKGPGIDFKALPQITFLKGYSTKQTLGVGFSVMLEYSSRLLVSTQKSGTTIVLEFKKHSYAR